MILFFRQFVVLGIGLIMLVLAPQLAHAQTCVGGKLIDESGNDTGQTCTPGSLDQAAQNIESSAAAAYQFKNEGIFGCNQVAGANASAGTLAAIGGVYVPVNDAAVTLNTGILVYKECVLRPLQDRLRESAMSALLKKNVVGIQTGRGGNAQYPVNIGAEELLLLDKSRLTTYTNGSINAVHPAYRQVVLRANAHKYRENTRTPESILTCPYAGDLAAADSGKTDDPIGGVFRMVYPSCYALGAEALFEDYASARDAQALAYQRMMWDWGRGFYAVTDNAADPLAARILTPSSVVQESFQQILGSPVRQLESANDVGQMIGALFAGITTQALTDNKGLSGLTQSVAGQPSYLDQVARESSQGVIGAAVNAALTILGASRDIENRYLTAMNAIASSLTQTINQLRQTERSCWALVIPKAREYASGNNISLDENKILTSTSSLAFSQQVIDSQITPLANAALTNIGSSQKALSLIDQLIAGVTNTTSLATQRLALQQLDSLVAQRALHTSFDAENAAKQRDDVAGAMSTLVTDTATAWGDSPDPSTGWCNINNASIPRLWAERWKR
ncbi:hypothetical protein A2853_03470 [Candidatus Kaiserbacteria bacterium RIFCSPHIGHO2_01_FULL_55_17]|uniref:Uncharacterized protein n=1 Tax=Candidatus Kaiserbacteria bacterium RIFCSPHIGHO2_01_FULL_55_17 TaxID=1798484 RepID=A0A1F6D952_9BACT|nr:MAG: hypothetical protein A2853_03470 [Candidatus Kaiserbacteria bacterium RIFCSPHIGHO2_01_FULL_55_17]